MSSGIEQRHGIVVFPSLHWHKANTAKTSGQSADNPPPSKPFDLGESTFESILPGDVRRGDVVMITGERGTFKTAIAQNFLVKGLLDGESGLLISLANRPQLRGKPNMAPRARMIARELARDDSDGKPRFDWQSLRVPDTKICGDLGCKVSATKGEVCEWEYGLAGGGSAPRLIEVNFRSGMLLPEEFVQIVRDILDSCQDDMEATRFCRVVLDDVSMIGLSYPLLRTSSTTGDLFLSAFVELMRNYSLDLVMTGTTGGLGEANEAVYRATALADAVVSCQYCNVFGDRYVTVRGQGLMRPRDTERAVGIESVPAVVHWHPPSPRRTNAQFVSSPEVDMAMGTFHLDLDLLEGLVGFDSGNIRRPGILVYLFSQYKEDPLGLYTDGSREHGGADRGPTSQREDRNEPEGLAPTGTETAAQEGPFARIATAQARLRLGVHERYNASLQTLIESAFGRPEAPPLSGHPRPDYGPEVSIARFDSTESEAVHDSLKLLRGGRPVDHTVLYSLDEFWETDPEFEKILTTGAGRGDDDRDDGPNELKEHIVLWSKTDCVRPYYANVLLLAYRADVPPKRPGLKRNPESWEEVLSLARAKKEAWERRPINGGMNPWDSFGRAFWFDQSAQETLACALMDALLTGSTKRTRDQIKSDYGSYLAAWESAGAPASRTLQRARSSLSSKLQRVIAPKKLRPAQKRQLAALAELFHTMQIQDRWRRRLCPNACVYLCWYSQLRDLIDEYPALAERLKVAALPGGGFRGDWFLGIHQGSVSIGLGREVLKILCSRSEQYKRFALGVGLPTLEEFYKPRSGEDPGFFAWPGGLNVKVKQVREIHRNALSRSIIKDYQKIRAALATLAFQLTPFSGCKHDDEGIRETVERLGAQVSILAAPDPWEA